MANLRVDKITSTETFERTGSVQFDGSGDYLSLPVSSDFQFGSGDFTIECWIYRKSQQNDDILGVYNTSSNRRTFILQAIDDGKITFILSDNGTAGTVFSSNTGELDISTWYHIAVIRNGNDIKIFKNGSLVKSGTFSGSIYNNTNDGFRIGSTDYSAANSREFEGHISNVRILKGQALYTENFKPPMRELEVTPETVLLACQSKTDAALEKTGKTITVNGNAVASELTPGILTPVPKAGGSSAIKGSVEFSGGTSSNPGGYLTVPNTTDLRLGSSDFTVEAYVNFTNGSVSNGVIAALWDNTNNQRSWNFYFDRSGNNLYFAGSTNGSSGNNNVSASIDIEDSNWYHVAASRSGSTIRLFVNGVELGSNTSVGTYYDNTTDLITIGAQNHDNLSFWWKGFISNLRIVKGTALYTADFIPPTRELKKIPGTVLLCCQDPDNPLTEATGKTITPYGDLGDGSLGPELVTNNSVWTLAKGGSGATDWTVSNNGRSLAGTTVSGGYIRATYTLDKGDYLVSLRWTGGNFAVQDSTGYIVATDGTDTEFSSSEDGAYSFYMTATTSVVITGTSWSTAYTVDDISIKRIYRNNGASNFTPQVGDNRKVTFEGVTKINTDAYFYLPTGDTASREATGTYNAGTRGLFGGTFSFLTKTNTIGYITIASTGNAIDFGDLSVIHVFTSSLSSRTRGLWAGGSDSGGSNVNTIDYVTIATTGNALDFGDLSYVNYYSQACSSSTRGIISGGSVASFTTTDNIDYITTASKGNGSDFGNLNVSKDKSAGINSPTRGIFAGGQSNAERINSIEYITIATTGNGNDFGDLTKFRSFTKGVSSVIRGLIIGGQQNMPTNIIDYITISSTGNAIDFGDISYTGNSETSAVSSLIRGVTGGGFYNNSMEYVQISTTGNALDFGDLTVSGYNYNGGCSNGHGGLG